MKINIVMLLISLAIAALVAFGFYSSNKEEAYTWLITAASGIMAFVTLSGILAVSFNVRGSTGNIRAISILFLIVCLISNIIFSFITIALAPYVIINGILFLFYILIGYGIVKALK